MLLRFARCCYVLEGLAVFNIKFEKKTTPPTQNKITVTNFFAFFSVFFKPKPLLNKNQAVEHDQ